MTIPELREAALQYLLYEQTRRAQDLEPELPSFSNEQLRGLVIDILKPHDKIEAVNRFSLCGIPPKGRSV